MSRSLRRGAVAAVIIATAPILAACSAGDNAASLQVKPNSAATSVGSTLKLDEIVVVTDAFGHAPANVTVNIANTATSPDQNDSLVSVSVDGTAAQLSGPAPINAGSSLLLSGPGQVSATVPTLKEVPGQNAQVTFVFAKAGQVSVQALVSAGTGQYAAYAPVAPTAAPVTPTAAPGASTSALAGAAASGSPKPSASKSAKGAKSTSSPSPSASKTP